MADEVLLLTTTESRVIMQYRGACTCADKWRGPYRDSLAVAQIDRDGHRKIKHSKIKKEKS